MLGHQSENKHQRTGLFRVIVPYRNIVLTAQTENKHQRAGLFRVIVPYRNIVLMACRGTKLKSNTKGLGYLRWQSMAEPSSWLFTM